MADFMKVLGQPPQLRILLVGTFKDCLLVEGRLEETKAKLKKRIELEEESLLWAYNSFLYLML